MIKRGTHAYKASDLSIIPGRLLKRDHFGNKLLSFTEIFTVFIPAPAVLVLEVKHIMQRHHKYDVIA